MGIGTFFYRFRNYLMKKYFLKILRLNQSNRNYLKEIGWLEEASPNIDERLWGLCDFFEITPEDMRKAKIKFKHIIE